MEINKRSELPELLKFYGLPLTAVEVGANGAACSSDFLKAGIEHIYCVDAWKEMEGDGCMAYPQAWHDECYALALEILSPFKGRYTILKGVASEMCHLIPDKSLGLVYIDADHRYEGVKADIENYLSKLVDGGIIAFHDYLNEGYGVNQAVKEFAQAHQLTIHEISEGHINNAGAWVKI